MAFSIFTLIYTVIGLFILQKIAQIAYRYIRTLIVTRKVPGLPGTRLLQGDLWFSSYEEFYHRNIKYVQDTGVKMYAVWMYFFMPLYTVTHPDTAKVIFTSFVPKRSVLGYGYTIMKPWIDPDETATTGAVSSGSSLFTGNGILAHEGGPKWDRNRKLLTPAFHFEILKGYAKIFNAVAEDLLKRLSKEAKTGQESVEVTKPITSATLDALLRCAFSYEGNVQELGDGHPYAQAVHRLSALILQRMTNPFMYQDFIYRRTQGGKEFFSLCDYVHTFAEDIIENRRKTLSSGEGMTKRHSDFLDILLKARDENGNGLSTEEIRAEADTFLFAGHDTTSSAISFAIYALAKYPEEQEKVYQEVSQVVGQDEVEWDHLPRLTYLQLFIKETMRMYSTVPQIGRTLDEPLTFDGVTIPENSIVEINIAAINHRPDVWPDHEEFRPDRFAKIDADRDPFSYVPFSAGSRNCIGQNFALNEQKVILARLVQTFQIKLDTSHLVEQSPSLVMRTTNGIKVFLHSR